MKVKLIISRRTNWTDRFYIRFKAKKSSMLIIKKIAEELGENYFNDNQTIPRTFSDYNKWKDQWIPLITKNFRIDIICANKLTHIVVYRYSNLKIINDILDKYTEWVKPKQK